MKLSVWSSYYYPLSPEEAVERLLENGITCTELSDEHGAQIFSRSENPCEAGARFAEFIAARGFEIPQGHLPLSARICSDDTCIARVLAWVDMYRAIGIKHMVLHCDNLTETLLTREEKIEKNKALTIEEGSIVYHEKYGRGVVEQLINYGSKSFCSILFDNIGRRLLDPNLAELKQM